MKKRLNKILSAMTATCMAAAIAVPYSNAEVSAAVTWKCGDVNSDGKVNLSDQVALSKYLNGRMELPDYSKADMNADHVIDAIDSKIFTNYMGEKISSLPYMGYGGGPAYQVDSTTHINTAVTYNKFDASTRNLIGTYTLESNALPTSVSTYANEVVDERELDTNNLKGVVKLVNGADLSTGFIIDAHTIATAAHCVAYHGGKVQVSLDKILIIADDGSVVETITDISEVHVPILYGDNDCDGYYKGNDQDKPYDSYDYALITVSQDLSEYACFNLGVMEDGMKGNSRDVYMTGFPRQVDIDHDGIIDEDSDTVNGRYTHKRYTCIGNVIPDVNKYEQYSIDETRKFFYSNAISSAGNSGGPVYVKTTIGNQVYYTVIGINTSHYPEAADGEYMCAVGTRMTTEMLHFYKNNPNISY